MAKSLGFLLKQIRSVFADFSELSTSEVFALIDVRIDGIERMQLALIAQLEHLATLRKTLADHQ